MLWFAIEPIPDTHYLWAYIMHTIQEHCAQIAESLRLAPLAPEPASVPLPTFTLHQDDLYLRDVQLTGPVHIIQQPVHFKEGRQSKKRIQ